MNPNDFLVAAGGDSELAAELAQLEEERLALFELFRKQNVYVFPTRVKWTPVNAMFTLALRPDEQIKRVRGVLDEVGLLLSNMRGDDVEVRLNSKPFFLDVPHLDPSPIYWDSGRNFIPHHMLAGRGWSFRGGVDQVVNLMKEPHVLVAGITGSGKSVMVLNLILSLAMGTTPEQLVIVLVDLKNEDLVPLAHLPHSVGFAGNPEDAIESINWVYSELEKRRDSVAKPEFRIALVIDELAQLPGEAKETLNKITQLGRSMKINALAATQHPNGDTLGGVAGKVNYGARFTGLVSDAGAAVNASGRPKTGAENLPGNGAFIRTGGPSVTRLQSFLIEDEDVDGIVMDVARRWAGVKTPHGVKVGKVGKKTVPSIPAKAGVTRADLGTTTDPVVEELEAVFAAYYDGTGGLNRGGMSRAIEAIFGNVQRGRGYGEQTAKVQELLQEWLTRPEPELETA